MSEAISSASSTISAASLLSAAIGILTNSALKLGTFGFQSYEIPEQMPFGGAQSISVKKMLGGSRDVQALGRDDIDVTWSGRFQGTQAAQRAEQVDALRIAGNQIPLVWGTKNLNVIIKNFLPKYERAYQVPYTITVTIVTIGATSTGLLGQTLSSLVGSDVLSAVGLNGVIGDVTLGAALSNTQSVLGALGPLTGVSALGQAGQYLGVAQGAANVISGASTTSLSGLVLGATNVAGGLPSGIAGKLVGAGSASLNLANALGASNFLTRAVKNVAGAS